MTSRAGAPKSVVIVGGGVGGVATAAALRSGGYAGDLTIVEASDFPYDRPPLSKGYLTGSNTLADIALKPVEWYGEQSVRLLNNSVAVALRPSESRVALASGSSLSADVVVLAPGAHAARPRIPGVDLSRVHVLRDREDADRLRAELLPGARLLVVGGGLIGAEAASTALHLGADVTLVDPLEVPLEQAVGPETAKWLHDLHAQRGITTLRAELAALEEKGDTVLAQLRNADAPLEFDVVLLGVGLRAETSLAEGIGLHVERGVIVDAGQVSSNPSVLAVGDSTRRVVEGGLRPRSEHWEAAQHDGERAAATILGAPLPATTAPWFWTDRHHHHVEAVGHMSGAARRVLRGAPGRAPFSVWGVRDGRVVAAVSVDDPNAVRAARRMIDRGTTVTAAALADAATDLRRLVRGSSRSSPSEVGSSPTCETMTAGE